jgi:hypothetical protein
MGGFRQWSLLAGAWKRRTLFVHGSVVANVVEDLHHDDSNFSSFRSFVLVISELEFPGTFLISTSHAIGGAWSTFPVKVVCILR